ncbi:MAG: YtxH domain-containing protein [Actinomycetota bacterium]
MEDQRFGYEEFGLGLLLGVALGSVIGLLLAPQSGAATREQITSKATGLKSSVQELIEQARKSLEQAAAKVESALGLEGRSIRRKLDKLRAELEKYNLNEV